MIASLKKKFHGKLTHIYYNLSFEYLNVVLRHGLKRNTRLCGYGHVQEYNIVDYGF